MQWTYPAPERPGLVGFVALALLFFAVTLVFQGVRNNPDHADNPPSQQAIPGFDRGAPGQP